MGRFARERLANTRIPLSAEIEHGADDQKPLPLINAGRPSVEEVANIWMIDFAKTTRMEPSSMKTSGENGYLTGLNNLISFIENVRV